MEKNKIMMIAIIVLLVVLLITIGLGFYFMFTNMGKTPEEETPEVKNISQEEIQLYILSDAIYTNLLVGTDNKEHVIKISVSLGIDISNEKESAAFLTMLADKEVVVKDVVTSTLRKKTFEELKKSDAQEVLRDEILSNIQKEFNSNLIAKVYISELFLQ